MLFLGSERYPGENEYKSYLASHGGRSNASTSLHTTTYKFEVLADYAEKAFDIFSNFFISPLFSPSGVSREVQAVDSENRYVRRGINLTVTEEAIQTLTRSRANEWQ